MANVLAKFGKKLANFLAIFKQKIELRERSRITKPEKRNPCNVFVRHLYSHASHTELSVNSPVSISVHIRRHFSERARAEIVLSSELLLLMSFSWPFFPGVGPGSFLPMVFLLFGIRFQNGAKECIV